MRLLSPPLLGKSQGLNLYQPKAGDGCILWLPGQDDPYSSTIRDRSGYGNNGTIVDAVWTRLPSGLWYLSYDGVDDRIVIADDSSLYEASLTLLFWVYRDNRSAVQYLMCNADSFNPRIYWFSGSDTLLPSSGTCYVDGVETNSATQLVWHFIAVTGFDFSGASGGMYWGVRSDLANDFPGDMALHRFLTKTLSQAEIQYIYNQERALFGV